MSSLFAALLLALAARPSWAGRIEARSDVRLELETVMEALSSAAEPRPAPGTLGEYQRAVLSDLEPHRGDAALQTFRLLFSEKPSLSAVARRQVLHLSPPPDLQARSDTLLPVASELGSPEAARAWLQALRGFARDAGFAAVHAKRRSLLAPLAEAWKAKLERGGYMGRVERYAGLPFRGSYTLVFAPFVPTEPGACAMPDNDDEYLPDGAYHVTTLALARGPEACDDDTVESTLYHELSHALIDTLADLDWESVERSRGLYPSLNWPCYGSWGQCVKEHMARAVMIRLLWLRSPERGERRLAFEKERFPYLPELEKKLAEGYEPGRKSCPNLACFYPELMKVFEDAAAKTPEAKSDLWQGRTSWLAQQSLRQQTRGRQKRALRYLALQAGDAPRGAAMRRRLALRLLSGDASGAQRDAGSALEARGDDAAARLALGLALSALGKKRQAAEQRAALKQLCASGLRRGSEDEAACADFERFEDRFAAFKIFLPRDLEPARPAASGAEGGQERKSAAAARASERAVQLYSQGRPREALDALERALKDDPDSVALLADQGVVLQSLKRFEEARASYDRAVALAQKGTSAQARSALADLLSSRSSLWEQLGEPAKARADLERALETAPPDWPGRAETARQLAAPR